MSVGETIGTVDDADLLSAHDPKLTLHLHRGLHRAYRLTRSYDSHCLSFIMK